MLFLLWLLSPFAVAVMLFNVVVNVIVVLYQVYRYGCCHVFVACLVVGVVVFVAVAAAVGVLAVFPRLQKQNQTQHPGKQEQQKNAKTSRNKPAAPSPMSRFRCFS